MQRLILLRHGKAESVAAQGGDFERGLTERGRRDAALISQVLAEAGMTPDLALVSAARRTRETWEAATTAFAKARCEHSRVLYLASCEQLMSLVDGVSEAVTSLMVVGHNPGLHEFALTLLGRARIDDNPLAGAFPTAGAAVFRMDDPAGPRFERFFIPRQLGGGA
jgi:phosphohistidine phosphatase